MTQTATAYYYANGQRIPLNLQEDLIAVKVKGADGQSAPTRRLAAAIPDFQPPQSAEIWPGGEMILQRSPGATRSANAQTARLRALNQRDNLEYASPVYEHRPGDRWIATNQIVVQFKDSVSEFDMNALNDYYGLERVERIGWLPRAYLLRLTPASTLDALAVANKLVESGHVVFAHPNFLRQYVHRSDLLQPIPELADHYWHLSAIEAFAGWQIASGRPEITVAIIDDGVDIDHVAFPTQTKHFNAIDGSDNPRPPIQNYAHYLHGTACAGLAVGAPTQTIGTGGVAAGCQLMAVRLLDRVIPANAQTMMNSQLAGEDVLAMARAISVVQPYREARAIQWAAEHGADVISNSWGPPDGMAKYNQNYPIDDVARLALSYALEKGRGGKGCVVCWAAGNGNEDVGYDGYASYPAVLTVAACTAQGTRADYSDYGHEVALCAPGGGRREGLITTVQADLEHHAAYRHNFNGTSAATPIVAGVAALLLSTHPEITRSEVYDILTKTADKIDPEAGQYDADGRSIYYGFGRVNVRRALEEAARRMS